MALNINGTTGISGVDGSVSAPALTGTDSNTGITFPSADTIKFATGGVERLSITNSGVSGTGVGGKFKGFALQSHTTEQYAQQSSYGLVGTALTYTATSASNKLLILHNHNLLLEDPQFWYMALYRDGLSGTQLFELRSYGQDSQWIPTKGITSLVVDIPDTSSHTYQFAMYRSSGTNRTVYNYHGGASSGGVAQIILFEFEP